MVLARMEVWLSEHSRRFTLYSYLYSYLLRFAFAIVFRWADAEGPTELVWRFLYSLRTSDNYTKLFVNCVNIIVNYERVVNGCKLQIIIYVSIKHSFVLDEYANGVA